MTRDEIAQLIEARRAVMNRRDAAGLSLLYTENGHVFSPSTGTQLGRDAIRAGYRLWFGAFPDFYQRSDQLIVEGTRAAELWTGTGTHRGVFAGLPASGRTFEIFGVFVYEFRDGLIANEWRIYDVTTLLRQIGLIKASAA